MGLGLGVGTKSQRAAPASRHWSARHSSTAGSPAQGQEGVLECASTTNRPLWALSAGQRALAIGHWAHRRHKGLSRPVACCRERRAAGQPALAEHQHGRDEHAGRPPALASGAATRLSQAAPALLRQARRRAREAPPTRGRVCAAARALGSANMRCRVQTRYH